MWHLEFLKKLTGALFSLVGLSACAGIGSGALIPSNPARLDLTTDGGSCDLNQNFGHTTKHSGVEQVHFDDAGALAFRTNYAVNTDGAPNSYHPDDPFGSNGLAINTICNGSNAVDQNGLSYNYSQCRQLVDTFRLARSEGWTNPNGVRMQWYGIAANPSNPAIPCINTDGPYAGYFVSTTALINDPSLPACSQDRYINALDTNFIIRPRSSAFSNAGMELGDVAAITNSNTGEVIFAVVGDVGPSWGLGEGSVSISQILNGRDDIPSTRRETYGYGAQNVFTLILPGEPMSPPYTQDRIDEFGREALQRFGGIERLSDCNLEIQ